MVLARAKLCRGKDVIEVDVVENMFGNDFLKEFTATFKEGDGMVGFGKGVVRFGGFGDDNHKGV